jgi:hypothetical protein
MTTWLPRWFALLVLGLPFVPVVAVDAGDPVIEHLVKELGSDKFKKRDAATKRLTEIGEPTGLDQAPDKLRSPGAMHGTPANTGTPFARFFS